MNRRIQFGIGFLCLTTILIAITAKLIGERRAAYFRRQAAVEKLQACPSIIEHD